MCTTDLYSRGSAEIVMPLQSCKQVKRVLMSWRDWSSTQTSCQMSSGNGSDAEGMAARGPVDTYAGLVSSTRETTTPNRVAIDGVFFNLTTRAWLY